MFTSDKWPCFFRRTRLPFARGARRDLPNRLRWNQAAVVPTDERVRFEAAAPISEGALVGVMGRQKATVAGAGQLCCYLFWMLKEGWTYESWLLQHDDLEVRQTQRMAPRHWTAAPRGTRLGRRFRTNAPVPWCARRGT